MHIESLRHGDDEQARSCTLELVDGDDDRRVGQGMDAGAKAVDRQVGANESLRPDK